MKSRTLFCSSCILIAFNNAWQVEGSQLKISWANEYEKSKCMNNLNTIVLLMLKIEYVHMFKSIEKGLENGAAKYF